MNEWLPFLQCPTIVFSDFGCVCLCVYLHVQLLLLKCASVESRGGHWVSLSITLRFRVSCWTTSSLAWGSPGSKQCSENLLSLPFTQLVLKAFILDAGDPKSSSFLCSKCSYQLSHHSNPFSSSSLKFDMFLEITPTSRLLLYRRHQHT